MSQTDPKQWSRARRAREKLVAQFIDHPDVSLINIGSTAQGGHETEQLVLRIHVRERWFQADEKDRVSFPEEVDGIPVSIVPGDYYLSEK